jgi:hypothetical protein
MDYLRFQSSGSNFPKSGASTVSFLQSQRGWSANVPETRTFSFQEPKYSREVADKQAHKLFKGSPISPRI